MHIFIILLTFVFPNYRKKDIPGGDPKNPLGTRWIGFDADNSDGRTFGIHGTNRDSSIGLFVTQGCIRMHNKEVEKLFSKIPLGTKVLIVNSKTASFEALAKQYGAIS
ncbi:L,D-transpeptidase [Bacillus sp. IB182487]|uniref:L,D-transpeptidase n=1 Tax=Metabacillus arenae TaxID=2771434 RepID=A0A926N8R7_9BACI|nr:L,D-transpeptidase [Metabacillus arenae]